MARTAVLLLISAAALGHGESSRTQGGGGGIPTVIVRFGAGRNDPGLPGGPPSRTERKREQRHTWETWWSYHRDYHLVERVRGTPTTGPRALGEQDPRRQMREGRVQDLFLEALEDKDHDVRAAAAIALGKCGFAPGFDRALERHVNRPPEAWFDVRESALYAIGLFGLPEYRIFLNDIASARDRDAKEASLSLTGLMMDGTKESADAIAHYARWYHSDASSNPSAPASAEQERRRYAIHLLGFVKPGGYDDFLWQVVQGGRQWETAEQGLAVTALGRRRARDYKEGLFRLLYAREFEDDVIRSTAIALGQMLGPDDAGDLKRLARFVRDARRDPVAQNFAVMALGQVGGETAVELLRGLLDGRVFGDDEDRAFVHLALGLCGRRSGSAKEALVAAYNRARSDTELSVLALACGLARAQDSVPITLELLEKPGGRRDGPGLGARGRFAGWAALGLGFLGDERGVTPVRKVFEGSNDPVVREQAAIALALLNRGAAVEELVAILKDAGSLHTKAAVVTALALVPEPTKEVVDALEKVYRDDRMPNPVRGMAITALGALVDPRPIPVSALLSRNYNYLIRCLALDEVASYL
jgi:HEAT repeat protein